MSNFFHYFSYNFEKLGLKKLITTCYKSQQSRFLQPARLRAGDLPGVQRDKNGNGVPDPRRSAPPLKGDGDFRSAESIELLKQADIVVTNPPFSLFREYLAQLVEHEKKFLILANQNAVTYKEVFPLSRATRFGWATHSGDCVQSS